ncbi:MAG TPA: rod shape-determining protein MreD [Clostridiales bacterium]|nr:rod shape-determining protein MreD [Clostridiales bacterium]
MKINKALIRSILTYAGYIIAIGLLQTSLPEQVSLMGAKPDLTLILAVLCGYLFGQRDGMMVGLSAGFFRDMLAGRTLGLGMLTLMYAGLIASVAFRQLFRRNVALGLVQVFIATIVYEILMSGLNVILPMLPDVRINIDLLIRQLLDRLPGAALTNVLASIPLMLMLYFFGPYIRGTHQNVKDESITGENL